MAWQPCHRSPAAIIIQLWAQAIWLHRISRRMPNDVLRCPARSDNCQVKNASTPTVDECEFETPPASCNLPRCRHLLKASQSKKLLGGRGGGRGGEAGRRSGERGAGSGVWRILENRKNASYRRCLCFSMNGHFKVVTGGERGGEPVLGRTK